MSTRSSRKAPKTREVESETREVESGAILVFDIERFSDPPGHERQRRLIKGLADSLDSSLRQSKLTPAFTKFTGDGYIVAFDETTKEDHELVEAAWRVVKAGDRELKVRCGIHRGPFAIAELPWPRRQLDVSGSGINDAVRVSSFADGGGLVLSESFYSHWKETRGPSSTQTCFTSPVTAIAKHGRQIRVRVYRDPAQNGSFVMPSKIRKLQSAQAEIFVCLARIERAFDGLLEVLAVKGREKSSTRVSVFLHASSAAGDGQGRGTLEPTVYRFHRDRLQVAEGRTTYDVPAKGGSPQAQAWREHKVVVCSIRADSAPGVYEKQARDNGFTDEQIGSFSRRATCFAVFPIMSRSSYGTSYGVASPKGVVCIDSMVDTTDHELRRKLRDGVIGIAEAESGALFMLLSAREG